MQLSVKLMKIQKNKYFFVTWCGSFLNMDKDSVIYEHTKMVPFAQFPVRKNSYKNIVHLDTLCINCLFYFGKIKVINLKLN